MTACLIKWNIPTTRCRVQTTAPKRKLGSSQTLVAFRTSSGYMWVVWRFVISESTIESRMWGPEYNAVDTLITSLFETSTVGMDHSFLISASKFFNFICNMWTWLNYYWKRLWNVLKNLIIEFYVFYQWHRALYWICWHLKVQNTRLSHRKQLYCSLYRLGIRNSSALTA